MTELLVFGGRNHENAHQRPAWDRYETALVVKLRDGVVVDRLEYKGWTLDEEVGLSRLFRSASIVDGFAYTCTSTQVLKIDLKSLKIVEAHTHRLFNDLHHVAKFDGHFFVAGTGVDSVLEFDDKWEFVKRYPVTDDELMRRHGMESDFRRIPTTKPHNAHPNYLAQWGGEIWVTNFEAGRVQSITSDRRHHVSENRIHDGMLDRGKVWFTAVNGAVIRMDPATGNIETFELATMTPTDKQLGWCRSIQVLGDNDLLVGFSRIRDTKLRENLKWLGNKLLGGDYVISEPTRIARYDLAKRKETWRFDLEPTGVHAVFSILEI